MKISICIPQYNRIDYLLKSLEVINNQNYDNFEVVISDDCSTDDTSILINDNKEKYRFPIIYFRFQENQGYDRNLRKSIELATGQYCFILGNDDTLHHEDVLYELSKFLEENHFPDIGFSNYCDFTDIKKITRRALSSRVIGSGPDIGLLYYSAFSFVAGLIFKKSTFDIFNTNKYDKSIYSQIALSFLMITKGAIVFSIDRIWVKKDISLSNNQKSNSYLDTINRSWKKIKPVDGGLRSIISVLTNILVETNTLEDKRLYYIFKKLVINTYPYWILDYKYHNAIPEAIGLFKGFMPHKTVQFQRLKRVSRLKIIIAFYTCTFLSFIIPAGIFFKYKHLIYKWIKRK